MISKAFTLLALSITLSVAANAPQSNALETVVTGNYSHSTAFEPETSVLDWNIDRGEHFDRILAAIRKTKPEVCIFQEVDLGARRSGRKDIAKELAEEAGMNYAFVPEFRELSQGAQDQPAYHGQATLTMLPIRSARVLRFVHQTSFWKPRPFLSSALPIFQRREGGRVALITELDDGPRTVVIYNVHLESKLYDHLRLQQMNEILADAERYPASTPVIIAGDLNSVGDSAVIPRLREAGYRSAFGDQRVRTHFIGGALDWVFVRGQVQFANPKVLHNLHASDHDAISVGLRF